MSSTYRSSLQQTANKIESAVENKIDLAKDKFDEALDRLKRVNWSSYEEEALRFGLLLFSYMSKPLLSRPFENLAILQALDKHTAKQHPKYNGYLDGLRKIIKDEGFQGLFKGAWAEMIYEITKFGFRVATLNVGVRYIPDVLLVKERVPFLVAGIEIASAVVAYPIAVASTRLVAQSKHTQYSGIVDCLEKIAVEDSDTKELDLNPFKPEWYAGFSAHILSTLVYAGTEVLTRRAFDYAFGVSGDIVNVLSIQRYKPLPAIKYETGEALRVQNPVIVSEQDYVLWVRNPVCSILGLVASYPFQLVATRMQAGDKDLKDKNVFEALRHIRETEGFGALYKGLIFN